MNKLENTPRNFRKFAALYLYQEVLIYPFNNKQTGYRFILSTINNIDTSYCALELTPLSQISDEDALIVSELLHWGVSDTKSVKNTLVLLNMGMFPCLVTDYLRSKGYALTYLGLSVDDLVSYGWVKLKGGYDESI